MFFILPNDSESPYKVFVFPNLVRDLGENIIKYCEY